MCNEVLILLSGQVGRACMRVCACAGVLIRVCAWACSRIRMCACLCVCSLARACHALHAPCPAPAPTTTPQVLMQRHPEVDRDLRARMKATGSGLPPPVVLQPGTVMGIDLMLQRLHVSMM